MDKHLLILGILMDGKMHGYKLYEYVNHVMGMYTEVTKPTLYYTLTSLETDGYVSKEIEREGNRPERRVYEITKSGKEYFISLLREQLKKYNRTYFSDDIGIIFMNQLPDNEIIDLLSFKKEIIENLLQDVQNSSGHDKHQTYLIEHTIAHLKADFNWIRQIINDLEQ